VTITSCDTTPPDTLISSAASGTTIASGATTNTGTVTIAFTSTESGSTFQCSLDGGSYTICTTPKTYSGLTDGSHTITIRAIDPAGNIDATPASRTFTVDTIPPNTTIVSGTLSGSVSGTGNQTFTFVSTETGSIYECRIDGGSYSLCTTPISYTGLTDGSHIFQVRAIDLATNTDPTPAATTFVIDTTPPTSPNILVYINSPYTAITPEIVFGGSIDVYLSGYTISVDGSPFISTSSPYYPTLTGSTHIIIVRAYDTV
jgi:hypothetical protein